MWVWHPRNPAIGVEELPPSTRERPIIQRKDTVTLQNGENLTGGVQVPLDKSQVALARTAIIGCKTAAVFNHAANGTKKKVRPSSKRDKKPDSCEAQAV